MKLRCRTLYEAALYELNILKNQYIDDMKTAFDKCVEFERARLDCIQDCLEVFAKAIDGMRGLYRSIRQPNISNMFYNIYEIYNGIIFQKNIK